MSGRAVFSRQTSNVFVENILAEAFEDCKKLGINVDGYVLKNLRFADDIALIADSENDLQTLIELVHDVSKKYGMEISIPKNQSYDILSWRSTSS